MAVDALVLTWLLDKTGGTNIKALGDVEILPDSNAASDAVVSAFRAVQAGFIAQIAVLVDSVIETRCCTFCDTGILLAIREPSRQIQIVVTTEAHVWLIFLVAVLL